MGVDYYSCQNCGDTFPDCGYYFTCDCECMFCNEDCGGKETEEYDEDEDEGEDEDEDEDIEDDGEYTQPAVTCIFCRLEDTTDSDLLGFMLTKHNLTRAQLLDMWRLEQDEK